MEERRRNDLGQRPDILERTLRYFAFLLALVFGIASSGSERGEGLDANGVTADVSNPSMRNVPEAPVPLDGLLLAAVDEPEGQVYIACWGLRRDADGFRLGFLSKAWKVHGDDVEFAKDVWQGYLASRHEASDTVSWRWNCLAGTSALRAKAEAAKEFRGEGTTDRVSAIDEEFL